MQSGKTKDEAFIAYLDWYLEGYPYEMWPKPDAIYNEPEDRLFTKAELNRFGALTAAEMARVVLRNVRARFIEIRDRAELDKQK